MSKREWPWSVRRPDNQLSAYYYSFEPTGCEAVDNVLRAVAYAGKMYHHTDQWSEGAIGWREGQPTMCDLIQQTAEAAATALAQARAEARAEEREAIDRWSRDPEFTWKSMRELREQGASCFFVGDACDPNTPEGDTTLHVRVLVAREEHKRIRLRMVGTRKRHRDAGYYMEGLPPLGYKRAHPRGYKGLEKNVLQLVPKEAALVRRIFRMYLAGHSMARLSRELGVKVDRVKDALHRRVYLGEVQDAADKWIPGKHEPIIDRATFDRVQETIARRTYGGPRPRDAKSETFDWVLRDVARCAECGRKMSAAYAGPKGARRYYYRCSKRCNPTYVPVREVEALAMPLITARLAALRGELARPEAPASERRLLGHDERRAKLDRRRERTLEMYADEAITRDELRVRLAKIDEERARLDEQEAEAGNRRAANPRVRRELLANVQQLTAAWGRTRPEVQRRVVNALAEAATVAIGRPPVFSWFSTEDMSQSIE